MGCLAFRRTTMHLVEACGFERVAHSLVTAISRVRSMAFPRTFRRAQNDSAGRVADRPLPEP